MLIGRKTTTIKQTESPSYLSVDVSREARQLDMGDKIDLPTRTLHKLVLYSTGYRISDFMGKCSLNKNS